MDVIRCLDMQHEIIDELKSLLQGSDAQLRKHWAERIANEKIPFSSMLSLLHGHEKTAQRFTWLIGDLLDVDPAIVAESVPMLFSLRDQMPFPGMQRSVAKCLWYVGIPDSIEEEAVEQLFEWLKNDEFEVGVKHYASKALYDLAIDKKIDSKRLEKILKEQSQHENKAHAGRIEKLRIKLVKKLAL
jgi:hypothetical protein